MSEYPIQSLSICCPGIKCINNCKTCTARQHTNPYENKYHGSYRDAREYWDDLIKRMRYAQSVGCKTVVLTGTNEPQQDRRWLEGLYLAMKSLPEPFVNIEMQTTGAMLMLHDFVPFLKEIGVTTIALSIFSIDREKNAEVMGRTEGKVDVGELCNRIRSYGLNIRMCFNVTDKLLNETWLSKFPDRTEYVKMNAMHLLHIAECWGADQVTFRKMWSVPGTPEHDWIQANTEYSEKFLSVVKEIIFRNGVPVRTLPYGATIYDYNGMSIVIDNDSMAKDTSNTAIKYYIIRENGKLYCSWDSKASLIL